jgi:hypothetical protein
VLIGGNAVQANIRAKNSRLWRLVKSSTTLQDLYPPPGEERGSDKRTMGVGSMMSTSMDFDISRKISLQDLYPHTRERQGNGTPTEDDGVPSLRAA